MAALVLSGFLMMGHPFRQRARFLFLIYLPTALITAALLSASASRYIHHVVPLVILLAAALITSLAHGLVHLARRTRVGWQGYARAVALLVALVLVGVGSGYTLEFPDMPRFRIDAYGVRVFKFPNLEQPVRYVSDRLQPGDVVLATDPHHIEHLMEKIGRPGWTCDYWPASVLNLPATIDDKTTIARDRRKGTVMLPNLQSLEELFARKKRIWFIVQPERHNLLNIDATSIYLRQHMDVVYEDAQALVLFRGDNHWTTSLRQAQEQALHAANANYLP
jgi:hypothetical protein